MKKRFFSALTLLVLLMLLLCPGAMGENGSNPLFYRVSDQKGHEIYLMGTIHVGNEALYPLPEIVTEAFEKSDVLAVEVDLYRHMENPKELLKASQELMYAKDGKTLDDERIKKAAEELDMPESILKTMSSYGIMSLLEENAMKKAMMSNEYGIDMYFLEKAHKEGKQVDELESLEEQFNLLGSMSEKVLNMQIDMYLDYPASAVMSNLMMLNLWKEGNRTGLVNLLEDESMNAMIPKDVLGELEAFNERMYTFRDNAFTKDAKKYLDEGVKVFFAVGAAHVAGRNGIADQLAEMGYTVEELNHK